MAQQNMRIDQPGVVGDELGARRIGHAPVHRRVALVLGAVADSAHRARTVRVERKHLMRAREQQNLLGPGLADAIYLL